MEQSIDQISSVGSRSPEAAQALLPAIAGGQKPVAQPAPKKEEEARAAAVERVDTVEISESARRAAQDVERVSRPPPVAEEAQARLLRRHEGRDAALRRSEHVQQQIRHREVQFNNDLGILTGKVTVGDREVEIPPEVVVKTRMRLQQYFDNYVNQQADNEPAELRESGGTQTEGEAA